MHISIQDLLLYLPLSLYLYLSISLSLSLSIYIYIYISPLLFLQPGTICVRICQQSVRALAQGVFHALVLRGAVGSTWLE